MKKKAFFSLIYAILVFVVFVACQKTPENLTVLNKNENEKVIVTIENEVDTDIPLEKYQDSLINKKKTLLVNIDAKIKVPDSDVFTTAKVVPYDISQDLATDYLNYFAMGRPIYEISEGLTKEQINFEIIAAREKLAEIQAMQLSDAEKSIAVSEANEWIKYLLEQYDTVPSLNQMSNIKGVFESFQVNEEDVEALRLSLENTGMSKDEIEAALNQYQLAEKNKKSIIGQFDLGKRNPATINIYKFSEKNQGISFSNTETGYPVNSKFNLLNNESSKEILIDYQTALKTANNTLQELEMDYMRLYEAGYVNIYDAVSESESYAYSFIYTRILKDIPITYVSFQPFMDPQEIFHEPWMEERLILVVDQTGLIDFLWQNPIQIDQDSIENIEDILSFNDAINIFKQQILIQNEWTDSTILKKEIIINDIVLGLAKIKVKNSDEYQLVPVWDFLGHEYIKYDSKEENGEYYNTTYGRSFLTINAQEGTIINRELGY